MQILKWGSINDFYLLEPLKLDGKVVYRLTYIRKKDEKKTEAITKTKHRSGKIYPLGEILHNGAKGNIEIINLKKEEISQFTEDHYLNPYILTTWVSRNNDESLTYNPRRFFTYYDDALIAKRDMFGKVKPFFLVKRREERNDVTFISLNKEIESVKIDFSEAHRLSLWHMFQENNLEYRVYLSSKALQKTILKALNI